MTREESIARSKAKYESQKAKEKKHQERLKKGREYAKAHCLDLGELIIGNYLIDYGYECEDMPGDNPVVVRIGMSICSPKDWMNSYSKKIAVGYIGDRLKNKGKRTFQVSVPFSVYEDEELINQVIQLQIILMLIKGNKKFPNSLYRLMSEPHVKEDAIEQIKYPLNDW